MPRSRRCSSSSPLTTSCACCTSCKWNGRGWRSVNPESRVLGSWSFVLRRSKVLGPWCGPGTRTTDQNGPGTKNIGQGTCAPLLAVPLGEPSLLLRLRLIVGVRDAGAPFEVRLDRREYGEHHERDDGHDGGQRVLT